MRFRGVASLHQVGALMGTIWSGGTGETRPEWADRRGSWRGGSQFPFHQLWGLGSAVSSPSGVRGGAPATESLSCILCHQIASPVPQYTLKLCVELFSNYVSNYIKVRPKAS